MRNFLFHNEKFQRYSECVWTFSLGVCVVVPSPRYNEVCVTVIPVSQGFVAAVERLFPYVTLVLSQQTWPPVIPAAVPALSQRVALHLNTASLHKGPDVFSSLMGLMDRYDVIVEEDTNTSRDFEVYEDFMTQHAQRTNTNLYVIPAGTRLMRDV